MLIFLRDNSLKGKIIMLNVVVLWPMKKNFKIKKEYAKNISYEEAMDRINIIVELF